MADNDFWRTSVENRLDELTKKIEALSNRVAEKSGMADVMTSGYYFCELSKKIDTLSDRIDRIHGLGGLTEDLGDLTGEELKRLGLMRVVR